MVDVEQRSLRAFEQQVLAGTVRVVKCARHVRDHRASCSRHGQRLVVRLLEVHRLCFR